MPEKSLVDQNHFARGDKVDAQFGLLDFQIRQQRSGNFPQQPGIDFSRPLAVGDDDVHSGFARPRCSS